MAPEAPGNLVVIELRFQNGELKGFIVSVDYDPEDRARIEEAGTWFYVLWNENPKGKEYIPIGGGVVYVNKNLPPHYNISPKSPIELDSLGEGRYALHYPALGEGLMLVLILPEGYSLANSQPMPRSTKIFKKKRLAIAWKPEEKYGATVKFVWEFLPFTGDLRAERDRINASIDRSKNVPDNVGAFVDSVAPQVGDKRQEWKSAWANGSFYLFAFAVVIAGLGILANSVPPSMFALILISGVLFVPLIGALQLKQDKRLSDKSFVELVKIVVEQLPLIGKIIK